MNIQKETLDAASLHLNRLHGSQRILNDMKVAKKIINTVFAKRVYE